MLVTSPLEIAAKAMREVPDFWMRVNKLRDDGRVFEVGHSPDPEFGDPVVVSAFSNHDEATMEVGRLTWEARARAALRALAEAEMPDRVALAGAEAMRDEPGMLEAYEDAAAAFRAMLLAIAEEKG